MHCLQSRNFLQDIHAGEQKESFHFAEPQTIMFHRHFAVSRYIYIIRKDEEETVLVLGAERREELALVPEETVAFLVDFVSAAREIVAACSCTG